ncbi:TetR/AcrR family transcriptional regulator [Flavisphingomonas formosensis]|uniref:TetR/AcrR family transcriptional regulator n=1 Tax=Flavisphingomonas formosensis TaxID=861534 RepID=UPI0012F79CA4|nr:TetR/AcrR family transcriptional regulator [Sphingomonas formosensis]
MRYDSEHKARTRGRVLGEAAQAIRVGGIAGVSVAEVMGRAGLTHGGFYAHFKSKDDLIAEAIQYMFEERYARYFEQIDKQDPSGALGGFIDSYLSMRHRDAPDRGCPIPSLSPEATRMPEAARTRFVAGITRLIEVLSGLVDRLGIGDAETVASSVLAELVGAMALARTVEDRDRAERLLDASRNALQRRLGLTATEASSEVAGGEGSATREAR